MTNERIVWMQDLNPMTTGGGSQANDRGMIREGIKRGYEIAILTPENQNKMLLDQSDFMILSNVTAFDPEKFKAMKNRYAVFHHDWWFQCKWRLYFPMNEKCQLDCPQSPIWEPILKNAALNIFLSPLHHRLSSEKFGDSVEPHILVPSSVNPDKFFDFKKPDRNGTCNVHGLLSFKGRNNNLAYARAHKDEQITFIGAGDRPNDDIPQNVKVIDEIAEPLMPRFYNEFETYIELPDTPQPFNRTVVEAYLCGCKIRSNELMGCLSWPWMKSGDRKIVAEKLREAPGEFWNGIESVL